MSRVSFKFVTLTFLIYTYIGFLHSNEMIYALMITGKDKYHERLAMSSIRSFLKQTYPYKKLIIVNDGTYSFRHLNDPRIIEIQIKKGKTLGELRNTSLDQVPKEGIWIQWDDDDWHHPNCIEEQYSVLKKKKADAVMLKNQVRYSMQKNSAWKETVKCGIAGTIMARKIEGLKYPKKKKGEDSDFGNVYLTKHKLIVWNNPALYYLRFIHGHNTWGPEHFILNSKRSNIWDISNQEKTYLKKVLNKQYKYLKRNKS